MEGESEEDPQKSRSESSENDPDESPLDGEDEEGPEEGESHWESEELQLPSARGDKSLLSVLTFLQSTRPSSSKTAITSSTTQTTDHIFGVNEDEEEDEEEEEDDEEEEDEDGEYVEESTTTVEEEVTDEDLRDELINQYLNRSKDFIYLRKKNAYLQDKLYQLCHRKGIIKEKEKPRTRKKTKRQFPAIVQKDREPDSFLQLEELAYEAEEEGEGLGLGTHKTSKFSLGTIRDEEGKERFSESEAKPKKSKVSHYSTGTGETDKTRESVTGLSYLREAHLQQKYSSAVQRIIGLEQLKVEIGYGEGDRIMGLMEKKRQAEKECLIYFHEFMSQIRTCSKEAVNSSTGERFVMAETEDYILETEKIFHKLRDTIRKFYMTWHELNYQIKILEEAELQGQEGLQLIEYEQLCGENISLKDKVDYGEGELQKSKTKIAYAVQILAHIREREFNADHNIINCRTALEVMREKLENLTESLEDITITFSELMEEQKKLEVDNEIIDNQKLMTDFRVTSEKVTELQKERQKLNGEARNAELELQNIQDTITLVREHKPEVEKMACAEAVKRKQSEGEEREKKETEIKVKTLQKMNNRLRLLELLETRHNEPWKRVKNQLMRQNQYRTDVPQTQKISTVSSQQQVAFKA